MDYREITADDSKAFWDLMNRIDKETDFMMFEPSERLRFSTEESLRQKIKKGKQNGDFLLGAFFEGELVGYLSAARGEFRRTRHKAYIITAVAKDFQGRGIGSEFFRRLDIWAGEQRLKRLELTVETDNKRAIALYERSGFAAEGEAKCSMLVGGVCRDELYMSKLL